MSRRSDPLEPLSFRNGVNPLWSSSDRFVALTRIQPLSFMTVKDLDA
jgi:hypothetical protein